jgi:hypothetical protein
VRLCGCAAAVQLLSAVLPRTVAFGARAFWGRARGGTGRGEGQYRDGEGAVGSRTHVWGNERGIAHGGAPRRHTGMSVCA